MPVLHTQQLLTQGQTAGVFLSADGDRVYKLFKFLGPGRSEQRLRAVFAAERQAYQVLTQHPQLRDHAPRLFGTPRIDAVLNNRSDASHGFLLDCCLELERVQGGSIPVFAVEPPHRLRVLMLLKRFEKAGIDYVLDAEVFDWQRPDEMKLVDFAVRDARADYPDQ